MDAMHSLSNGKRVALRLAGDTLPGQHSGNGSASDVSVAFIRFI